MDDPNVDVKRHALHAVAYMGGNTRIVPELLSAALSVDIGTDQTLADSLTEAFGPYGVPLSLLSEETIVLLLAKFVPFEDLDIRQGAIPRFLSQVASTFPVQVLEFLIQRIHIEESKRQAHEWNYRALGIDHHAISFAGSPGERKPAMLSRCLLALTDLQLSVDTLANLFWDIDPIGEYCFQSIIEMLGSANAEHAAKVAKVVRQARRPSEHIYGELRRLSSGLPEGSQVKTVIDQWWDLTEERRRNAPAQPDFERFSAWPEE
jgi:hypothetical protein